MILGVGDGYNDVNMLQTAHIGIGIQGIESSAADAFADFSVPKFRDLRRMMFWHGRSYGNKVYIMILMDLFKMVMRLPHSVLANWFNLKNGFELTDGLFLALYNVCFTTLYIGFWCVYNYDVDQS